MKNLLSLLILLFMCSLTANAQQNYREMERALLKGIPGVNAQFVIINEDELKDFAPAILQRDLELRLGKAGIKVGEGFQSRFSVLLTLHRYPVLTTIGDKVEPIFIWSASITVMCSEKARLIRDPTRTSYANIWTQMRGFAVNEIHIKNVRESIDDIVDDFINDFLAANPK